MLTILRNSSSKPNNGLLELDLGHPLAQGLQTCWLLNEHSGYPQDVVRRHVGLNGTGIANDLSWRSGGMAGTGTAGGMINTGWTANLKQNYSFAVGFRWFANSSDLSTLFGNEWGFTFAIPSIRLQVGVKDDGNGSGGDIAFLATGSGIRAGIDLVNVGGQPTVTLGTQLHTIGLTIAGTNATLYYEGHRVAATTTWTVGDMDLTQTGLNFGIVGDATNSGQFSVPASTNVGVDSWLAWNRTLTAAEMMQALNAPWSMIQPTTIKRWFLVQFQASKHTPMMGKSGGG